MVQVKICGITSLADAMLAAAAGADLLGFNFYPPSPRFVEKREAPPLGSFARGLDGPGEARGLLGEAGAGGQGR